MLQFISVSDNSRISYFFLPLCPRCRIDLCLLTTRPWRPPGDIAAVTRQFVCFRYVRWHMWSVCTLVAYICIYIHFLCCRRVGLRRRQHADTCRICQQSQITTRTAAIHTGCLGSCNTSACSNRCRITCPLDVLFTLFLAHYISHPTPTSSVVA
jgi:hypothetical protein